MRKSKEKTNTSLLKMMVESVIFGYVIDVLLVACLLLQDLREVELFSAPPYKWLLLLMCGLLLFRRLILKKKIGVWLPIVLGVFCLFYVFSWVVCHDKIIFVPAIILVAEVIAFVLYIKDCLNNDNLIKRFFRIILVTSIVLAVIGFVQMISYGLGWKWLYGSITQFESYLVEGRMTSIYSEPAHLCAIFGAGIFVSLYYLVTNFKVRYYFILVGLVLAGLMTGSIITYAGIAICFAAFLIYYFAARKVEKYHNGLKLALGVLACGVVTAVYLVVCSQNSAFGAMDSKLKSLSGNDDYGAIEAVDTSSILSASSILDEKIDEDSTVVSSSSETSDAIIREQWDNLTSYAIKSNLNIGIEKMKDGYYFGTGIFSHIVFYDSYMKRIYPDGYVRINYSDACCMPIRVLSEFGIIGLIVFVAVLLYALIRALVKKDMLLVFMLAVFVAQSMRLGEYNWILNCLCFVYIIYRLFQMKGEKAIPRAA